MDAIATILGRRSIRSFTEEAVADEQIRTMLTAAMSAPSAGNSRVWRFVVVTDRDILKQAAVINPYAAMAARAPLGIMVCADTKAERFPGYWQQDCAASMQNLLLAAHALGLGAVWTGVYPMQDRVKAFAALLSLPEGVIPMGFAVIGHPAQALPPHDEYVESFVHANRW